MSLYDLVIDNEHYSVWYGRDTGRNYAYPQIDTLHKVIIIYNANNLQAVEKVKQEILVWRGNAKNQPH